MRNRRALTRPATPYRFHWPLVSTDDRGRFWMVSSRRRGSSCPPGTVLFGTFTDLICHLGERSACTHTLENLDELIEYCEQPRPTS